MSTDTIEGGGADREPLGAEFLAWLVDYQWFWQPMGIVNMEHANYAGGRTGLAWLGRN